ncbi:MAG: hypothetical protein JSR17_04895 [Proteobacteria bacterium]|nr:hypothetical protein [Pseudomonadota bacterium]
MGRTALIQSAPIATILIPKATLTKGELAALIQIAALNKHEPLDQISMPSSTPNLVSTQFNQATAQQKQVTVTFVRGYLGYVLTKTTSEPVLSFYANALYQLIQDTPLTRKVEMIQEIGKEGLLKAAMVNPAMASLVFHFLISLLKTDRKKWLYFSLHIEQIIKQINIEKNVFHGPDFGDHDQPYIAHLMMLYAHWPQLRAEFKKTIETNLSDGKSHDGEVLTQTELQLKQITQNEFDENFNAFISTFNPVKPKKTLALQQALGGYTPEQLAWFTLNAYINQFKNFGALDASTDLQAKLSALINTHGREALLGVLHEKNTQPLNQQVLTLVEKEYDKTIKELSFNARRWLFLTLLLEDNDYWYPAHIVRPTGSELDVCNRLIQNAHACPIVTRLLHQRLVARLKGEENSLFEVITQFIKHKATKLDDQMRLWQYLSLTTHQEPHYFAMMQNRTHEVNMGNVIYRTVYTPLSALFARLANYSHYLRSVIFNALLTNVSQSAEFEERVSQLKLYQSHAIKTLLKTCDKNALHWLYFTLLTNMHQQQTINLGAGLTISRPVDRNWLHAEQILDIVDNHPEATRTILNELETLIEIQHIRQINAFSINFLKAKLNKLSTEAKEWLYWTLKTLTVKNQFPIAAEKDLALPPQSRSDLAKILYLIRNNIDLIGITKDHLLEALPQIARLQPENENYNFFAYKQCQPGEFCFYESLSEERSLALIPMLLKSTAKATKSWLAQALSTGVIDSHVLIQALPSEMRAQVAHELELVPNILNLALKWPSVRKRVIQACGGNPHDIKPVSVLVLDDLNFSEKGMLALSLHLKEHLRHLTHFSAVRTNLTDDALYELADVLIGNAPLSVLQLHHNPQLSTDALLYLFNQSNIRLRAQDQGFVRSTLMGFILDSDVLSWLSVKLNIPQSAELSHYHQDNSVFFMPASAQQKFRLASALVEDCKQKPFMTATLKNMLHYMISPELGNNQLVHAAVSVNKEHALQLTAAHTTSLIKNKKLKAWLQKALSTGKLELIEGEFSEQDTIFIIQLCCLLLMADKTQRFVLGQQLGMGLQESYPPITHLSLQRFPHLPILQSTFLKALLHNRDTIKHLTVQNSQFDDNLMSIFCDVLKDKRHLKHLNLDGNPIQKEGAKRIGELLTKNPFIKELCLTHWDNGLESFNVFASELAKVLSQDNCLTHLDFSENQFDTVKVNHLFDLLIKFPHKIKSLKLNGNHLGDFALKRLAELIKKNTALESIEIDGHHANPDALAAIEQAVKENNNLVHFAAFPTYHLDLDSLEEGQVVEQRLRNAHQILENIQESLQRNIEEKQVIQKMCSLQLSQELPRAAATQEMIKRSASSPCFDSMDFDTSTVLQFSGSQQKGSIRKPLKEKQGVVSSSGGHLRSTLV